MSELHICNLTVSEPHIWANSLEQPSPSLALQKWQYPGHTVTMAVQMIVTVVGCLAVGAQLQSTGSSSHIGVLLCDCQPFRFPLFHLITSKFIYDKHIVTRTGMPLLIKASMFLFKAHIYILIIKTFSQHRWEKYLWQSNAHQDKLTRVPYIIHPTPPSYLKRLY